MYYYYIDEAKLCHDGNKYMITKFFSYLAYFKYLFYSLIFVILKKLFIHSIYSFKKSIDIKIKHIIILILFLFE